MKLLLLFLALLTWAVGAFGCLTILVAANGAVHEIQALLIGGFGFLTGSVLLVGSFVLAALERIHAALDDE